MVKRSRGGRLWTLLVLIVVSVVATGCGSGPARDDPHHLVIGVAGHFVAQMRQIAEAYERENPGLTIEVQSIPDDAGAWTQRLVTARLGEQLPDIVENVDTLINQLADARVTADLSPWFASGGELTEDDLLPEFLGQYRPISNPDEIHGMPVSADATVLFYNERLFKEAGVGLPTGDWTWDDMYAAAKAITEAGDGQFYGMVNGDPWQAVYNPMIQLYGGFVYDGENNTTGIGSPEAIEAWETILRPYTDGTFAPYGIATSGAAPTFESGKVAMLIGVRANVPTIREQLTDPWDVAPIPLIDGKRPVGGGSYGLSMTTTSQRKEVAWEFLTWFYRPDGGMKFLEETYQSVPPTSIGLAEGIWRDLPAPPENVEVFDEDAKAAVLAPALPRRAQAVLENSVQEATQKVVLSGVPVDEAFGEAQRKVAEALESR
ncbi:MAG TPA: sugar ABC transporter substrate-binding protein [Thermomicrobiales bacterium]|nr:sugar ABC transporter substrate-binding protein [Thermomicrobiales bacterium]